MSSLIVIGLTWFAFAALFVSSLGLAAKKPIPEHLMNTRRM